MLLCVLMHSNAKNKERMEDKIKNIIKEFANPREETLDNAVKRICALFNVSKSFYCQQGMGIGGKDCDTQCEYCKED